MQTRARAAQDLAQRHARLSRPAGLRPSMYGGCSQAIIDKKQTPAWQIIHLENLLLAVITDCGTAVTDKSRFRSPGAPSRAPGAQLPLSEPRSRTSVRQDWAAAWRCLDGKTDHSVH